MPTIDYISNSSPLQLLLVVAASFLIGLSMEVRKAEGKRFTPGGVRTFPLICLCGFLLGKLGGPVGPAFIAGLAVLGLWMGLLYWSKLASGSYGMTTEVYALAAYVIGGVAAAQLWWLFGALTVLMVALQELKDPLETLARRLPPDEMFTIAKFVLLTAVILPLMPDRAYTRYELEPRKIWLVVVAVASVSYVSYLLQRYTRLGRHSVLLTGLLGGAYSSTVTTVVLARRAASASAHSRRDSRALPPSGEGGQSPFPQTAAEMGTVPYAWAILAASGVMNFRLLALLAIFSPQLTRAVLCPLAAAGVLGATVGTALCLLTGRRQAAPPAAPSPRPPLEGPPDLSGSGPATSHPTGQSSSPLELKTALTFAAVFVLLLVLTDEAARLLGAGGLYGLAGLSGLGVVDPFVLGLTQRLGTGVGPAALAVVVAASANHLAKGAYAALLTARRRPPSAPGFATAGPGYALTKTGPSGGPGNGRPTRPAARTGLLALVLLNLLAAFTLAAWALSVRLALTPTP